MDTKDLRAFKAVYELGSITKAAADLYITQQGLSKTIAKLETELGKTLFTRTHQGVVPTDYACALYAKATKLTTLLESIESDAEALSEHSALPVASVTGVILYLGLAFIDDFEETFPTIDLEIEEGSDRRIAELLNSGAADIGFLAGPVDRAKFDATLFSRHRHVLVANKADPLATKPFVSYGDLTGKTIALLGRDYSPFENNVRRFSQAGVLPKKLVEVAEGNTGIQLAATGQAVFVSTDYAASAALSSEIAIVPFEDDDCSWDIYLVSKKDAALSEDAQSFRTFALEWIASNQSKLFLWEHSLAFPCVP